MSKDSHFNGEYKPWPTNPNYLVYNTGKVFSKSYNDFMKQRINCGYYVVGIDRKVYNIHFLVASLFCPNPENKPVIDHIDRNPLNNNYTNLRWATYSENAKNKPERTHGLRRVQQFDLDGKLIAEYKSLAEASRITGIDQNKISRCLRKNITKYTGQYNKFQHIWKYVDIKEKIVTIPKGFVPIPGFDGYHISRDSRIYSELSKKYLSQQTSSNGYKTVSICRNGKQCLQMLHRLVAEVFLTNKPKNYKKMVINHIDGNKQNNVPENLEYTTHRENSLHSTRILGNNTKIGTSGKVVWMLNPLTWEILNVFTSAAEAGRHVNRTKTAVSYNCAGITDLCADVKFVYANDYPKGPQIIFLDD